MHRFTIRAAVDPQALPRVVGQIARHWITPSTLSAERVADELLISFTVGELSADRAALVGATIDSFVVVHEVRVEADVDPGAPDGSTGGCAHAAE